MGLHNKVFERESRIKKKQIQHPTTASASFHKMSIKVSFEIGHEASLRARTTPEGYTHDWELFVRGHDGNDISHYVDKVVFTLHDSFPKPRRVLKEPPYVVKEQGYAGFILPIEIYFKNKSDEPKKKAFSYDLDLTSYKVQREECCCDNREIGPLDNCSTSASVTQGLFGNK